LSGGTRVSTSWSWSWSWAGIGGKTQCGTYQANSLRHLCVCRGSNSLIRSSLSGEMTRLGGQLGPSSRWRRREFGITKFDARVLLRGKVRLGSTPRQNRGPQSQGATRDSSHDPAFFLVAVPRTPKRGSQDLAPADGGDFKAANNPSKDLGRMSVRFLNWRSTAGLCISLVAIVCKLTLSLSLSLDFPPDLPTSPSLTQTTYNECDLERATDGGALPLHRETLRRQLPARIPRNPHESTPTSATMTVNNTFQVSPSCLPAHVVARRGANCS
jgi:hypothetical protein